jgi:hypothetical protein
MPDSYGKRQRNAKKARKLAEREERRLARKQHRADAEAGVIPEDGAVEGEAPLGEAPPEGAPPEGTPPEETSVGEAASETDA